MWKSCGFFLTSKGYESVEIVLSGQKFALSLPYCLQRTKQLKCHNTNHYK